MNAIILTNTIPGHDERQQVQAAVIRGIGKRIEDEQWTVKIFAPQEREEYFIRINGPKGFSWEHSFAPGEQAPNFIEQTVRDAVGR